MKSYMKTHLRLLTTIAISTCFSCGKDHSNCPEVIAKYSFLDSSNLRKNPYQYRNLDSLVYLSDMGDTLVLHKSASQNEWVGGDYNGGGMDCGNVPTCYYEEKSIFYDKSLVWQGYFRVFHGKRGFVGLPESENKNLGNTISFGFNSLSFRFKDSDVDNPLASIYLKSVTFNNRIFNDVIRSYVNNADSNQSQIYYNKDYGVVHIVDKTNNTNWTLQYP